MILNRQRRVRVPLSSLEQFLERVQQIMNVPPDSLAVCLVTDAEIGRWNHTYRGKDGPTDVLSFPANETNGRANQGRREAKQKGKKVSVPLSRRRNVFSSTSFASSPSSTSYFGDIAIAPAVARRNVRRFRRTLEHEMRLLILHGAVHLMGYDHETDHGEMDRLEARLRRRLGLA
ncbi:MAG: rRNA maturation RNase YbeY [Candidatus Acidiferrales bacterium]